MDDSKQFDAAKDHKQVRIGDIGKDTEQLTTVKADDLMPLPGDVDWGDKDFEPLPDSTREKYACILDDVNVLPIPRPKSKEEEEELVNKFLDGMRKLFDPQNNWTFLSMLETTMENCAKCNTCSDACHLFEATGQNEMYRPLYRSEIFRRIYKKYVKEEPLSRWRSGDVELNWRTVARLGELAYRCNVCRRCAQTCPIGADNALVAREIRKIFSQEMGITTPELHENGSMLQMKVGSSTGMNAKAVIDNLEFIDEDFSEETGYEFKTPLGRGRRRHSADSQRWRDPLVARQRRRLQHPLPGSGAVVDALQ